MLVVSTQRLGSVAFAHAYVSPTPSKILHQLLNTVQQVIFGGNDIFVDFNNLPSWWEKIRGYSKSRPRSLIE